MYLELNLDAEAQAKIDSLEVDFREVVVSSRKKMPTDFWNHNYNPITGYLSEERRGQQTPINLKHY